MHVNIKRIISYALLFVMIVSFALSEENIQPDNTPMAIEITGHKYLAKGKTATLSASIFPETAPQKVAWVSSNEQIATVDSEGRVKGISSGSVTITAYSKANNSVKAETRIDITKKATKSISIPNNIEFIDMSKTKTLKIKATAKPKSAIQKFIWSSSNTDVATVNNKGKIKAKKAGTTRITVSSQDGTNKQASFDLFVFGKGYTGADLMNAYKSNKEFIAWIKIPGTDVNYPVVKSDNIDYYLNHTFDGKKSSLGTLFSLGKCDWKTPSKNIVIYGHDVEGSGKKMFKKLLDYKNSEFYKTHRYIYMDSIYGPAKYEVFAAFDITVGDIDPSATSYGSKKEFMNIINKAKQLTKYKTKAKVQANDTIISLVTCDRFFKRHIGRFIVMAKKVN